MGIKEKVEAMDKATKTRWATAVIATPYLFFFLPDLPAQILAAAMLLAGLLYIARNKGGK